MADNTFEVEYAANNRSKCKGPCKEQITKGQLRLVKVHKSGFSDDKLARDYMHPKCMFQSFYRVKEGTKVIEKTKDISGLSDLKKADQEKVKKLLEDWKAGKLAPPKRATAAKKAPAKKAPASRTGKGTKRKREEKPKRPKGIFGGIVFAIDCPGRLALTDKIEENGGRVVGSITQLVTYVIIDDTEEKSIKLQRAKANGKKLVTVEWLNKKIKEGVKIMSSSSSESSEPESSSSSSEESIEEKKTTKGKKGNNKPDSKIKKNKSEESDESGEDSEESEEEEKKGVKKGEKQGVKKGVKKVVKKGEKKKGKDDDSEEDSDSEPPPKRQKQAKDFTGMCFAISGTFPKKRQEIFSIIKAAGGTYASSVTKDVTHVLIEDVNSTTETVIKAKAAGKKLVDWDFMGV